MLVNQLLFHYGLGRLTETIKSSFSSISGIGAFQIHIETVKMKMSLMGVKPMTLALCSHLVLMQTADTCYKVCSGDLSWHCQQSWLGWPHLS
jgi:hypothetical protein